MRQDARVFPRVVLAAVLLMAAACALDEAELFRAGAPTITADVGQLRVLSYDDDPATDRWIDVVTPDTDVFEEGDAFREADSRTADDDQPAERRRLFTGTGAGRTLLVQFDEVDGDVLVWDLAVGDPDQEFSDGTDVALADRPITVEVDDYFAVVRPVSAGPADAAFTTGDDPIVELVGRHQPDAGVDLFVDVYLGVAPGDVGLVYGVEDKVGVSVR